MSELASQVAPIAVDDEMTIVVDDRPVTVDPPDPAQWRRGPGDVIRLLVALLATAAAGVILEWGRGTAGGLQDDVLAVEPDLPGFLLQVVYAVYAVLLLALPVLLLVWVITRRHWRLLVLYLVTTLMSQLAFRLLESWILVRLPAPPAGSDPSTIVTLLDITQDFAWVAGFAAGLTVTRPWIPIKWYRLGWILLLGLIPARLLVGAGAPSGRLFAMAAGWAIGSLALLVVGTPSQKPSATTVVRGLSLSGIPLSSLRRAGVDARGSTPYFAEAEDGRRYFVKVLGKDERNADLLFRVYRYLRLRNVGDEEPFSSLRRAVEHEAMTSVWAERAGVRTPDMAACTELEDGSMALAYGLVKGRSIDAVAPEELTDEFLRGMWGQVRILRDARIAHRDLRSANVFMTADGEPMMIDFGFGEVSASDELLEQDVAQLILSTAIDVGAQRAVAAAVEVLGPEAVAAAAPRMQAPALSGATQTALQEAQGLAGRDPRGGQDPDRDRHDRARQARTGQRQDDPHGRDGLRGPVVPDPPDRRAAAAHRPAQAGQLDAGRGRDRVLAADLCRVGPVDVLLGRAADPGDPGHARGPGRVVRQPGQPGQGRRDGAEPALPAEVRGADRGGQHVDRPVLDRRGDHPHHAAGHLLGLGRQDGGPHGVPPEQGDPARRGRCGARTHRCRGVRAEGARVHRREGPA